MFCDFRLKLSSKFRKVDYEMEIRKQIPAKDSWNNQVREIRNYNELKRIMLPWLKNFWTSLLFPTSALLDFITFGLCAPYSETTDGATFDKLLNKISKLGKVIFKMFQHPSMSITKSAGMIMRALIEEGTEANAKAMQDLALAEGAYPKHLLTALFTDIAPASRGLERKALANR